MRETDTTPANGRGKPRKPCADCGDLSPEGDYDVAIHDCASGEWELITILPKRWAALEALGLLGRQFP